MCGVIGLLLRDPELEPALGSLLVPMIEALDERGPDSAGVAVYADGLPPDRVHVSLGSDAPVHWDAVARMAGPSGGEAHPFGAGVVIDLPADALEAFDRDLASTWPQVRVLGTGRDLRVLKDVGRPTTTCARHRVGEWVGYQAVAHTRMATESAVTVLHSHPFVPTQDLCVVHNGSFSNYATVRGRLERAGVHFDSDNDSEVAARFLAARLAAGDGLEEATRWVMKEMDGFFTMVITTAGAMSVVRDAFACKPAAVAVTDRYVAVASEYRSLSELPDIGAADVFEPQPEEVYTWSR